MTNFKQYQTRVKTIRTRAKKKSKEQMYTRGERRTYTAHIFMKISKINISIRSSYMHQNKYEKRKPTSICNNGSALSRIECCLQEHKKKNAKTNRCGCVKESTILLNFIPTIWHFV